MLIYCSGIGGIGLSAYASLQKEMGHTVCGSDRSQSIITDQLTEQGIDVFFEQDGSRVPEGAQLFVYSEAIPVDAPERLRAAELGIPQQSYPEALGELSRNYTVIAVCGTHGKSSTTALVARLLIETGRDPTVVIGTRMKELDGRNWRRGNSSLFVIEACEYRKSFHFYRPQIILMTNCDGDHFDYYKSVDLYQEAFVDFLKLLPTSGIVITHGSDEDCEKVARLSKRKIIDADKYPLIDLHTPGLHMKQNAQLVLALAELQSISQQEAVEVLAPFDGTWRRMEIKGTYADDIVVIDDYAHHPREIQATISAAKSKYADRRIVCVFQPHTHNRTLTLYEAFCSSFIDAGLVIVPNIYDARSDTESDTVNVALFVHDIQAASSVNAIDGHSLAETEKILREELLRPGDILICMGAGDITKLATSMASGS